MNKLSYATKRHFIANKAPNYKNQDKMKIEKFKKSVIRQNFIIF